jgi:hypothetical protein
MTATASCDATFQGPRRRNDDATFFIFSDGKVTDDEADQAQFIPFLRGTDPGDAPRTRQDRETPDPGSGAGSDISSRAGSRPLTPPRPGLTPWPMGFASAP